MSTIVYTAGMNNGKKFPSELRQCVQPVILIYRTIRRLKLISEHHERLLLSLWRGINKHTAHGLSLLENMSGDCIYQWKEYVVRTKNQSLVCRESSQACGYKTIWDRSTHTVDRNR